ncbi:type II toxin-antitoxin system PemK/MazF family toxin [Ruminococcus flavefaciens]|uniref:type II toxin-antitoxin system PemK/MazF family toxin n=1 Tax=Ruminococcus flavefaciens TaxID=1265 RepID=UPI0026EDA0C6|nr:type II toxin-antitoxin system PemK/MazF family toxin [Ruminococcus flavefaciens]
MTRYYIFSDPGSKEKYTEVSEQRFINEVIPTHVRLHTSRLYYSSIALLEQIRTISKERLVKYIGTLSDSEMEKIDKALCISLGIDRKDKK